MKLSEYKDEEALDLLADLMEPVAIIASDSEVVKVWKNGGTVAKFAAFIIKRHKQEVMAILAALDGVPVEEYHCSIVTLPMKVIEIISDEDFKAFFISQVQTVEKSSSGSATETTEGEEK